MEPNEALPDMGSLGGDYAWFYQDWGARDFKATLFAAIKRYDHSKEELQLAAAQLIVVGLRKPARIVRQAAAQCRSLIDPIFCRYTIPPTGNELIRWQQLQQRRVDRINQQIEALLHRAGLDWDWFGEGGELSQGDEEVKAEG